jgi:hypothetical protein
MAIARNTSRWRGQKINACCISALQENCSHWIRRKTAIPEATFFVFLFHFHLFTMNVTQALPLEAIKGEAGATSRAMDESSPQPSTHTSTHQPSQETWDPLPLSKACNLYYKHSGVRQHEQ